MDRPNVDSLKPHLFHENLSAAIGSANHEVGGQGEEQGASCGEKKHCEGAAVDGKVPEHLDKSHIWKFEMKGNIKIFSILTPFLPFLNIITAGHILCPQFPKLFFSTAGNTASVSTKQVYHGR